MTESELIAEIKGKMGFPFVNVEIDPQHENVILNSTFRWFNARKGMILERRFNIRNGENEYQLEKDVIGVLDFIPEISGIMNYPTIAQDVLDVDYISPGYASTYTDLVQHLQMLERRREVFSVITSWEFISNSGTPKNPFVRIFPVPDRDKMGGLVLRRKMNRETLRYASPVDEELIARYGLTVLKEILVHIRGKYADLPAAQGPVSLDADRLADELQTERDKLEIEIRDWQEVGILTDRAY